MKAFVAFAMLVGAVPAAANPEGTSGNHAGHQQEAGQQGEAAERPVCRTVRDNSASRIGARRICRTPSEWRAATEQARRNGGLQD